MDPTQTASKLPSAHPFLAVIGGGNMGKAIVTGAVNARLLTPARVCVAEHDSQRRARIAAAGVRVVGTGIEAAQWLAGADPSGTSSQLLLAVKPQSLADTCNELRQGRGSAAPPRVAISILAGTTAARVAAALGGDIRVIRAMPNLPAAIGQGVTAIAVGEGVGLEDAAFAMRLFQGVGPVVVRTDETMMDAFTALAGSGPAYVFYLAEAMMQAARTMGFDEPTARRVVAQTVSGAGQMLAGSDESPTQLRQAVTSRGGTTQAALELLETRRVGEEVIEAILAARERGRQLGALQPDRP